MGWLKRGSANVNILVLAEKEEAGECKCDDEMIESP